MLDPKVLSENLLHELVCVRHRKVDTIKYKLASGAYKIKSSRIAKALVGVKPPPHKH